MVFLAQNSTYGSPHKRSSVGKGIRQNDPVYSTLILSAWHRRGMATSEELRLEYRIHLPFEREGQEPVGSF